MMPYSSGVRHSAHTRKGQDTVKTEQSRYQRAHDELDQYTDLMRDKLRQINSPSGFGSMLVYCVDQLDLDGLDPSGDWYATNAQRLESTLDTARAACGDEYPLNPRAIASRVHMGMAGGCVPLPKRSRFGQWHTTGAGVACTCGRSVWAWAVVEDAEPVEVGGVEWIWWRVGCRRCQLAILILYPDTEINRESMNITHRAVVQSFQDVGPGAVIRWGTRTGEPHPAPEAPRYGLRYLPTVMDGNDE